MISIITPWTARHPSPLTSKEAQAKEEMQHTAGESREDEAERGENTPNHHHRARPPASAQSTAHWAWKGAWSVGATPTDSQHFSLAEAPWRS